MCKHYITSTKRFNEDILAIYRLIWIFKGFFVYRINCKSVILEGCCEFIIGTLPEICVRNDRKMIIPCFVEDQGVEY